MKIKISKNNKQITTFTLILDVQKSVLNDDSINQKSLVTILYDLDKSIDIAKNTKNALDSWVDTHGNIVDLNNRVASNKVNIDRLIIDSKALLEKIETNLEKINVMSSFMSSHSNKITNIENDLLSNTLIIREIKVDIYI